MNLNFPRFRSALFLMFLAVSNFACSTPVAPPTASPSSSPAASAPQQPPAPQNAVAMEVTEVSAGEGKAVSEGPAYLAEIKLWQDKFDGTPMGRGSSEMIVLPESGQMPGLIKATQDMKTGGVKRVKLSAGELLGDMPDGVSLNKNQTLYLEVTVKEVFAKEDFLIKTTTPGGGERAAKSGDQVLMHYTGWLNDFESADVFDSSRDKGKPFPVKLGQGRVIPGWEKGLMGMKKGEKRRLSIPHYYAYGVQDKGKIKPRSRLFFEVELVDFVDEGELKTETIKEGSGSPVAAGDKAKFHYTGWLNSFEGKKFDSSLDRDEPIAITLGKGQVIKGWDQGLVGMKPGEVRRLTIPFNLAYGPEGRPPTIPPFATLYFEVTYVGLDK